MGITAFTYKDRLLCIGAISAGQAIDNAFAAIGVFRWVADVRFFRPAPLG